MALINFNNEQKLIENEIRKFAQNELEPLSAEIDKEGVFPAELIKKLFDLGFFNPSIPEKYGGAGLDATSLCIILEELSRVCASIGTIIVANNCLVSYPLMKYAPLEKKEHYLGRLGRGEIGAYSTLPQFDSENNEMELKKANESVVIRGKRSFVLNGEAGDIFVLPFSSAEKISLCIFNKTDGVELNKQNILGLRAAGITTFETAGIELSLTDCVCCDVTVEDFFKEVQAFASIGFSAVLLGIAEAAYDNSVKYSKERKQFKRAICEFPMVQQMLVDMKTRITALRLMVYEAAKKFDCGEPYVMAAYLARLYAGEAAVFAGTNSIQIHGGYGYTKDYPVERFLRDAKSLQVLELLPMEAVTRSVKEILA
ncbi:MAG TPA: hypothetical protein ENI34_06765 [candidate division WOR-3 bacterium]|uniref:Acyl-CoA dehydrogenase n=1 Tax=candidate division WOR-3 bacterium TaxID=2052148 RepID=A0A9C9EMS2_UNCW3|nr:hypothetical protein [candidate division WOR-3 bacterium]